MKIILMSDTHLGFGTGGQRWEDAFLTFAEGVEKGLEADLILLGGDIFDSRIPTQETFARAMEILVKARHGRNGTRVAEGINKALGVQQGVPVVTIHGNHERRVKGLINPVEALEKGGFLIHLHCNGVVLEKEGERVAVQGMSAVPTQYVEGVLKEWNPTPILGCFNILIFHQNIQGFVRAEETLPKASLPEGFDLYICGDIHEQHKSSVHGKPLLLPGSTVATQINKDSQNPRTFVRIDTKTQATDFVPFENQRKIHYKEFSSREEADEFLVKVAVGGPLKPVVKIKSTVPLDGLKEKYKEEAITMVSQEKEIPVLSREEHKLSVNRSGKQLLEKNLTSLDLDPKLFHDIFELLANKNPEEALNLLREKTKDNKESG